MASLHPETSLYFKCKNDFRQQRNPQTVSAKFHRACLLPGTLTAQDYVLKKKNNEVINVKCPICSSSTTVTKKRAAVKNPAEPAKKRVRTQPDPGPVEREPRTRPRAVVPISRQEPLTQLPISEVPTRPSAIVLNSHQVARLHNLVP
jgi:hypothetical protein